MEVDRFQAQPVYLTKHNGDNFLQRKLGSPTLREN